MSSDSTHTAGEENFCPLKELGKSYLAGLLCLGCRPLTRWLAPGIAGAGIVFLLIYLYGQPDARQLKVNVVSVHDHDPGAFTQGFLIDDSSAEARLYESTGLYGQSTLRKYDLATGQELLRHNLPGDEFGEGLALVGNRLIQLTWRNAVAHVYSQDTFETLGQFTYQGEGWGLCYDGQRLIMSNGSSNLLFRDPDTFDLLSSVVVTYNEQPLAALNELEFVEGFVYANVWHQDYIYQIDPHTGKVAARIDASGLLTAQERLRADVLNGIAYSPKRGTFFITGKWWPKTFEVTFVPK